MAATTHDHAAHDTHAHEAPRQRPTALASGVARRLSRVAIALVVLWLAVAWALWG